MKNHLSFDKLCGIKRATRLELKIKDVKMEIIFSVPKLLWAGSSLRMLLTCKHRPLLKDKKKWLRGEAKSSESRAENVRMPILGAKLVCLTYNLCFWIDRVGDICLAVSQKCYSAMLAMCLSFFPFGTTTITTAAQLWLFLLLYNNYLPWRFLLLLLFFKI